MVDVPKHVAYWSASAEEDWDAALSLISSKRNRHGLFFIHLALEKMLKALVTQHTGAVAPKIHALIRLADRAGLSLAEEQRDFLGEFDRYQIEGRYPELLEASPGREETDTALKAADEMFKWLKSQL